MHITTNAYVNPSNNSSPVRRLVSTVQRGHVLVNVGLIDDVRRDGVFVILTVRGTVWSLVSGRGDIHTDQVTYHEAEEVFVL